MATLSPEVSTFFYFCIPCAVFDVIPDYQWKITQQLQSRNLPKIKTLLTFFRIALAVASGVCNDFHLPMTLLMFPL